MMQIAVIDIGSNSIRYMEAEHTKQGFGFSDKSVFTTRLAQGLLNSGLLAEDRMCESISVLHQLTEKAKAADLPCFCYATSAVRDAENRGEFLNRVFQHTGLSIEVLSGEEEAAFARLGAAQKDGGLIDVGGGSSQIITETYRNSFPIGCVRVRDICGGKPLTVMETTLQPLFAQTYLLPCFSEHAWTAVGGTATTLAALSLGMTSYDSKRISAASFNQQDLLLLLQELDALGADGRASHPLLTKRHDVIRGGGLILLYLMRKIGIKTLHFSDADGLEGYAMHLLKGDK